MYNAFATKSERFQTCEYPACSFFDLVDSLWKGPETSYPLHRFCTLMRKMNALSYIQENLILNRELSDEKEMLQIKCENNVELKPTRLTFFCAPHEFITWDTPSEELKKYILGYVVIVSWKTRGEYHTFILEAVVCSPSIVFFKKDDDPFIGPVTNYYVHNVKKYPTTIGHEKAHKQLEIKGSFFCQQNGLTSKCAHAALRMAINSSPLLDAPKLTNKRINDIVKEKCSVDLKEIHKGLGQNQIQTVVTELGYRFHSANFLENTQIEYDHFIYPSLESCLPTILGIQGWNAKKNDFISHVVSVLGHTINSDRWEPEARCGYGNYPIQYYISSASWCDHFVIGDDNYGMFSTLPTDMLRNFIVPTKNPNLHATMAISILPNEIELCGYDAEQRAISVALALINGVEMDPPNKWHNRMKDKSLVLRTLLQTKIQYLNSIKENTNFVTNKQSQCFENLPNYIWVTEVSLPNVFTGNKRKLGDVVIRANATKTEHKKGKSIALAWFPGFIQSGPTPPLETWSIDTHVPIIRNTEHSFLEW